MTIPASGAAFRGAMRCGSRRKFRYCWARARSDRIRICRPLADVSTSARYLFGRRDRGVEAAKLTGAVREVEASLSKRISRLEDEVADHSGHIQDLRSKSVEAEQSMGRLLSAVEGFCEQAAIRLESVTAPALVSAAAAGAARAPVENRSLPEAPRIGSVQRAQAASQPDAAPKADAGKPTLPDARKKRPKRHNRGMLASAGRIDARGGGRIAAPDRLARHDGRAVQGAAPAIWWRSPIAIMVGLGTAVILLGILLWPSSSRIRRQRPGDFGLGAGPAPRPVDRSRDAGEGVSQRRPRRQTSAPGGARRAPLETAAPAAPGATRVELVASEPTWVSIRGRDGTTHMSGLIEPGKIQTVDIREPAVLRAGNAGGLTIRANGRSLGPLGPHGAIREVEFKNGDFKLVPIQ